MKKDAFASIIDQYEKLVFTICYQLVGDYEEAQNLTQETFISAYTHIDTARADSLKPWLARIAANKAKDFLKSAYFRHVKPAQDYEMDAPDQETPESLLISKETEELIRKKITSLPEPYHKASVLYFLEEKPVSEIAKLLRRPPKTVKTQLYRARQLLKQELNKEQSPARQGRKP